MKKEKSKAMAKGQLVFIELKKITITKGYNPRQIDVKSPHFLDLVESVKAQGVIVPVHVRKTGDPAGPYELLAGERRYRAASQAELKQIPAINHGPISDEQAFEITFVENFAREDLTTLEQGRAVGFLLERYKGDYTAVASKLGKAESWVRMRHAIETNLSEEWKNATAEGCRLEHFTAAHLALVARFPANVQANILNEIGYRKEMSVKGLAAIVADMLRLIRKAPFDTAKCAKCTKRSDAQPQLWMDRETQKVGTGDRCLDIKCWARKEHAARKEKLAELQAKYPGLVSICTKDYLWGEEARKAQSSYGKYLSKHDYEMCKKSDAKAVPAVIVNGKGAGNIQYIKIKHPDSPAAQKASHRTLKDLRKDLTERRWLEAIRRMCEQIGKVPFDQIMGKDGMRVIVWMAALYGTGDGTFGAERTSLLKEFDKGAGESAAVPLRIIWECISQQMDYIADSIGADQREGGVIAKLFSLDLDAEYKKVCQDPEFAEPTEWKNLNADGTPKSQKTGDGKQKAEEKGKKAKSEKQTCRECGCTEDNACMTDGEPCHWVEKDLCSACDRQ